MGSHATPSLLHLPNIQFKCTLRTLHFGSTAGAEGMAGVVCGRNSYLSII